MPLPEFLRYSNSMTKCHLPGCPIGKILWSIFSLTIILATQKPAMASAGTVLSHLQRARLFAKQRKWPQAEREFRFAHQMDPNSVEAEVGHAEALVQIRQPFDALLELQTFLRDHRDAARAHEFYAVVILETSNDFLLAQQEMETSARLAPNDGMIWKSLGDIYLDHTTASDAITAYKKARRLLPHDPLILASLAQAYSQDGNTQEADAAFATALKMAQNESSATARRDGATVDYLYAQYLLKQNRPRESIAAASHALAYNPNSAIALYHRARAYKAIGDLKNAEVDALRAFEIAPAGKEGPLLLADIYRKEHNVDKVQKYAEIAQKMIDEEQSRASFGRDVRRLLGMAESALLKQQFDEAIPPYNELIQKVPTFYEAYFGIGVCYSQTGRVNEAESAFRKYLSLQPVSADGHATLGLLLLQQGRGAEAIPELEQALEIDPTLDEARKALAGEYLSESKPAAAIKTLRAQGNKGDVQSITLLATALRQNGQNREAMKEIERALALSPGDTDALRVKHEIIEATHLAQ